MIDRDWFDDVCELADANLEGFDRERLPALLGEASEVLPFLLVHADGFADWPLARAALRQSIRDVPRPRDARPEGAASSTPSPARQDLYDRMRRTLVGNDVHWHPDWEERGIHVDDLLETIRTVRRDERRGDDAPSMFIDRD